MSDAAEIEASEAIADQIEQAWRDDQAAEALADDLGDDAPIGRTATAQQHWQIDGDKTAMWAIGKIHDATEERDRIRRNAQHQIEQIQAKALRERTRRLNLPCCYCGEPIDTDLPATDRMSFTADHPEAIAKGGRLAGQALEPMHRACNSRKSDHEAINLDGWTAS